MPTATWPAFASKSLRREIQQYPSRKLGILLPTQTGLLFAKFAYQERCTMRSISAVLSGRPEAARQPSTLTPRFPATIQKCLRCDFGYGCDLDEPRFQKAVYDGLVGPLQDMISRLNLGPNLA